MIQRYSLTAPSESIQGRFKAEVPSFYKPRYNAAPTQLLPVITASAPQGISTFYWGTHPSWAGNKPPGEKTINVRSEDTREKKTLLKMMMKNRCIVPADGFYVWKKIGKKINIPYRIEKSDKSLFSMAGVWEEFDDENNNTLHTFMLFTRPAVQALAPTYDRMPVMLNAESEALWLDPNAPEDALYQILSVPTDDALNLFSISPRINNADLDVPSLVLPTPPADQFGNLTLFDA